MATYPATIDVRFGTIYGPNDNDFTGSCKVPVVTNVRTGVAVETTPVVGTCAVPAVADVEFGVACDAATGTFVVPAVTDVRVTIPFGDPTADPGFVGTCIVPDPADAEFGVAVDVAPGAGTFVVPAEANVEQGTSYGDGGEFNGLSVPGDHAYIVKAGDTAKTSINHIDTMVIAAENAADAALMAQAYQNADSNVGWAAATATTATVVADIEDWTLRVLVTDPDPAGVVVEYDVTVTAGAADVLADLGDDMATALVAEGLTASYAGSGILTVAVAGDGIGDRDLKVYLCPPNSEVALTTFVGTIVNRGAAAAVLTAELKIAKFIPAVKGVFEQH